MSISGASAVGASASSQQMQSLAPHKHARLKSQSSSDTGAQSSNGTSAGGPTGNAGSKLDITA
jgi:hypothetical protein